MHRRKSIRQARTEQTYRRTKSVACEETVTDAGLQRTVEQEVSVSFNERKSYVEQQSPADTPNGSEIGPAEGRCAVLPGCHPRSFPAFAGIESTSTMLSLLTDALIRARMLDGSVKRMSLPEVYAEMVADRVAAFPALRPHQRHAWHAFLCQLGAIALHRVGADTGPASADEWRELLRAVTADFADDEPWRLIVEDSRQPAFMQCPAPIGLGDYRSLKASPDDLDILVTSKNHDVKQTTAAHAAPEDWVFALIDLQTMGGFLGAGNYQIARMNGGHSSRPCLGLAPADGGPGAHLCFDVRRMLSRRDALLENYPDYFRSDPGVALTWLEPWDGTDPLDLRALDPYFVPVREYPIWTDVGSRGSWSARTEPVTDRELVADSLEMTTPETLLVVLVSRYVGSIGR